MADIVLKLRILHIMIAGAIASWREAVRDLDARMCCDGRECGCMGSSNREFWEWETKREPRRG